MLELWDRHIFRKILMIMHIHHFGVKFCFTKYKYIWFNKLEIRINKCSDHFGSVSYLFIQLILYFYLARMHYIGQT